VESSCECGNERSASIKFWEVNAVMKFGFRNMLGGSRVTAQPEASRVVLIPVELAT
jgi:hypothetical protein